MERKFKLILFTIIAFVAGNTAYSQASLASEDIIDEVSVKTSAGDMVSYTLVRDAVQKNQWYYMPAQARLYEIRPAGSNENEPEFNLLKYQYSDPKNSGELLEGGIIQFALVMSPDNVTLNGLKAFLAKRKRIPSANIRLSALPLKSAEVSLVAPKGEFIAEGSTVSGIAPLSSTSKMVFSVSLSKMGTDVYDALTKSNTGMGVSVKFAYNGLTAPAGFTIEVDWDQTYKYYSRHDRKMASIAGAYKWFGGSASYNSEKQKLTQELLQEKCINAQMIGGEGVPDSLLMHYMDPILERINKELFETDAFGRRVDSFLTAQALNPDTARNWGGDKGKSFLGFLNINAHMSVAIKNINVVKKGKETVNFNIRKIVERNSVAGGFVGLGKYSEAVKRKLQILIAGGKWESAYFILPPVSDDESIGVRSVALDISLQNSGRTYSSQAFSWTKDGGWRGRNGGAAGRSVAVFPLLELARDNPDLTGMTFNLKSTINMGNEAVVTNQTIPAANSENNIALPLTLVDIITVDPELLSFRSLNPESDLEFVAVNLQSGTRRISKTLKPYNINGVLTPPRPLYWLLSKSDGSAANTTANIEFRLRNGTKVPWANNGRRLSASGMGNEIVLLDADYQSNQ